MNDMNKRVCRNVKALCKINAIHLGDLEKEIGRYPGFFSRSRTTSAEELVKIADKFDMTVDELIKGDFELQLFETEELDKVYAAICEMKHYKTKDEMMKWLISIMNLAYGGEEG